MTINIANLSFRSALRKRWRTDMIILHHAAAQGGVEAVHNYHRNSLGWTGIGYNFYVRKDGTVWEGRGLDKVGAHAGTNYNSRSVGICAEGNFERETMPEVQKQALIELVAFVLQKYPNCVIKGHREVAATACPGRHYPLDEIRTKAQQIATQGAPTPETPKPEPTPKPSVPTGGAFLALPILRRGANGEAVKALQILLTGRDFKPGRWGADGSFGGATDNALRRYQQSVGLVPDGICGNNTWRKLLGV